MSFCWKLACYLWVSKHRQPNRMVPVSPWLPFLPWKAHNLVQHSVRFVRVFDGINFLKWVSVSLCILLWNCERTFETETYLFIVVASRTKLQHTQPLNRWNPTKAIPCSQRKTFHDILHSIIYSVWIFQTRHKGCRLRKAPIQWYLRDRLSRAVTRGRYKRIWIKCHFMWWFF